MKGHLPHGPGLTGSRDNLRKVKKQSEAAGCSIPNHDRIGQRGAWKRGIEGREDRCHRDLKPGS